MDTNHMHTQTTIVAAGCFWGVEEVFRTLPGVTHTEVGYINGTTEHPTYEQVCTHTTGHAEAVKIEFDPAIITYEVILEQFFEMHDPTTLNRQGPDIGDQYRSGIYVLSDEERAVAEKAKAKAQAKYAKPIVTEIATTGTWWKAEEYHQQYFFKNGGGTCHI